MDLLKGKKVAIRVLCAVTVFALVFGLLPAGLSPFKAGEVYAWGNGGNTRTDYQLRHVQPKPNFISYEDFTFNIKGLKGGAGSGIGTHDMFLEQAIAQAIRSGADVSWIDIPTIQQATSEPDYNASVKSGRPMAGNYHGFRKGGTAPRDIGIIYKEAVAAINRGDNKTASRRIGWISHYLCDLTNPLHSGSFSQIGVIPSKRRHTMHVAMENDLDYYMKYSAGRTPDRWAQPVKNMLKYQPHLKSLYDDSIAHPDSLPTLQEGRAAWFNGKVKKQNKLSKPVRQLTIDLANYVRGSYSSSLIKAWAKTWKKGYNVNPSPRYIRKYGSKALFEQSPYLLGKGSDVMARLLIGFSNSSSRKVGIDHIKRPKIYKKYLKQSKKRKKKYGAYQAKFLIKDKSGNRVYQMPLSVTWKRKGGKVLKRQTIWTNTKGEAISSVTVRKTNKRSYVKVYVKADTSDYKTVTKKFILKRKSR
jgi:hypothetical protein